MEAREHVKSVYSEQLRHQNEVIDVFCVFIVNFEQLSHIVLMFPLLTLNK